MVINKIGNCRENSHAPVKYMKAVLEQLKDSDYLKISQRYDILCLGLIILKFLLYFDTEIMQIIDKLIESDRNIDNHILEMLRDRIKGKYFDGKYLDSLEKGVGYDKRIVLEYLKLIWKYMISPTINRRPAQYVIDKIIIYEKYKNDVF